MAKLPSAEQFWQFCLQCYPGMQQPLLSLQDELGANINLLLLLLYAEQQHWHWSVAEIAQLHQAVLPANQQVTLPIRQLRRQLSTEPTIKAALLKAELAAEQLEQQALLAACPKSAQSRSADLVGCYLQLLAPQTGRWQHILFDLRQSQPR
ncbi:TIGR02444 family protein [Alkalimonas amylolytica]|uniref:TIGR02444 family protein n=1 Tax=Alkalimonas amylolytica TaxID=152573 RepID=A0A1H4FTX7_ALKAM|nr:TIGR02444 family protein [Alkalimonas amylolytica]SEB00803.1 TIGR02444 family protein [Alkalimonas amylolytica]